MAHIHLLTDSAADIPRALRQQLGIQVLPFPIAAGDRELQDGEDLSPQEFYELLLSTPQIPTHAQLNPYCFQQVFAHSYEAGHTDLIYTSINAKGSATHGNALAARDEFYEDHPQARDSFRIHIIDSKCYTMGYGWAVVEGARMAAAGAGAEEIVAFIQDWVDHVKVVFAPFDLKFAKKSGRISAAAAFMGEALGLKPVMTFLDGESKILTKVRGEKAVLSTMVELCQTQRAPGSPYLIIRAGNALQADALTAALEGALGQSAALSYDIGGVISINAGPNLVGVVYRAD